jgi:hypothetical protein
MGPAVDQPERERRGEIAMSKSSLQSPLDDLTYDVITILQKKAKALEAYDKYIGDAEAEDDEDLKELFVEMRRQDEEHIRVLKESLARRLDEDLGYDEDLDEEEEEEEDYDDEDEDEVEEPTSTEHVDSIHGEVATTAGPAPRRGESSSRHR